MRPTDALLHRRVVREAALEIVAQPRPLDSGKPQGWWDVSRDLVEITTDCETYYVSADMTAVAAAAAKTMPREELRRDDLPAERGFMLFDRPVGLAEFVDASVPITAIAWGSQGMGEYGLASPGLDCTCEFSGDDPACRGCAGIRGAPCTCPGCRCAASEPEGAGEEFVIYPMGQIAGSSQLLPLVFGIEHGGQMQWICGHTPYNDDHNISAIVLTTWALMQQSLTVSERQPANRAERRRAARAQLPSDVLVVRLRRRSIDHDGPEDTDVEPVHWSHRWLVGGHWRNQWLPSRSCHRQQWISGYVKGPEGKPLLVKDRVTAWVR
jgi:hypothetical protein